MFKGNDDDSPKHRRPQIKRYHLMNDDEEFEASPNEYTSDEGWFDYI